MTVRVKPFTVTLNVAEVPGDEHPEVVAALLFALVGLQLERDEPRRMNAVAERLERGNRELGCVVGVAVLQHPADFLHRLVGCMVARQQPLDAVDLPAALSVRA